MLDELVDEESESCKSVYAHYGLAMYFAQCLEHGIVNALVLLEMIPNQVRGVKSTEEFSEKVDSFMDEHFMHTLGRLIKDLRRVTALPPDLERLLRDALKARNRLAHEFFREHAENFLGSAGRERMIEELEEACALIHEADVRLEAVVEPVAVRYGLTAEVIARHVREMRGRANSDL